jgi:hypothetical protein
VRQAVDDPLADTLSAVAEARLDDAFDGHEV